MITNFKKISKQVIAVFLAMILMFGTTLTCIPAYASTSRSSWNGHHRFKVDGNDAYCLNFSKTSAPSGSVNGGAWTYWKNNISNSQKENIQLAVTAAKSLGYYNSSSEKYFAVQRYIWYQTPSGNRAKSTLSNWFNDTTKPYYDKLVKEISDLKKYQNEVSSAEKTIDYNPKTGTGKKYVQFAFDAENYVGHWKSLGKSGKYKDWFKVETIEKNGKVYKRFTIKNEHLNTNNQPVSVSLNLQSQHKFYVANTDALYKFGDQEVIYLSDADYKNATLKVNYRGDKPYEEYYGKLNLHKVLLKNGRTSNMQGVVFKVSYSDGSFLEIKNGKDSHYRLNYNTFPTDANGNINLPGDIYLGNSDNNVKSRQIHVEELTDMYDTYRPKDGKFERDVTVNSGQTTNVVTDGDTQYVNVAKLGDFLVTKQVNDIDEYGRVDPNNYGSGKNGSSAEGFTLFIVNPQLRNKNEVF